MIVVEYTKYASPVSDWEVDGIVDYIIANQEKDIDLYYSTSNVFTPIRIAIAQGKISPKNICFKHGMNYIHIEKYGSYFVNPPEGFEGRFKKDFNTLSDLVLKNKVSILAKKQD